MTKHRLGEPRLRAGRSRLVTIVLLALLATSGMLWLAWPGGSAQAAAYFGVRIDAGGGAYTDAAGNHWAADEDYVGGQLASFPRRSVINTDNAPLYLTQRWGMQAYDVPVPVAGIYTLTLSFAEESFTSPGTRVMSVTANGITVVSNLDLDAAVGFNTAYDITVPVLVGSDHHVDLQFSATANDAEINGITLSGTAPLPPAAASGPPNLVTNGAFTHGTTDWGGWNSTLGTAQSTDLGVVAVVSQTSSSLYSIDQNSVATDVASGTTVRARAYVRAAGPSTDGEPVAMVIRERTPAGVALADAGTAVAVSAQWQLVTQTLTTAGQGDALDVYVLGTNATGHDVIQVADVSLINQGDATSSPAPTATATATAQPSGPPSPTATATAAPTPVPTTVPTPTPAPTSTPAPGAGMSAPAGFSASQLYFDDSFSGTSLGPDWNTYISDNNSGGYPWLESAGGGSAMSSPGSYDAEYMEPSAIAISNGLSITATPGSSQSGYSWTSGVVTTYGHEAFSGGYVQVRAWMPDMTTGMWPGIWFLGAPGSPEGPEIDLDEGGYTAQGAPNTTMASDLHATGAVQAKVNTGVDMSAGWNVYGIDYVPGQSLTYYLNGKQVAQYTSNVPSGSYFLILDLQVAQNAQGWHTLASAATPTSVMKVSQVQFYSQP